MRLVSVAPFGVTTRVARRLVPEVNVRCDDSLSSWQGQEALRPPGSADRRTECDSRRLRGTCSRLVPAVGVRNKTSVVFTATRGTART